MPKGSPTEKLIAACGLDCSGCEAYIATQSGDADELAKVAKHWSEQYGGECTPEYCICDGCLTGGRISGAHASSCQIRDCVQSRGIENCAQCDDYICEKLAEYIEFAPQIGERLAMLRGELNEE